jgi:hypothetical protein
MAAGVVSANPPPQNFLEPADPMKPADNRATPAELTAAAHRNPRWKGPRTSWGAPNLQGLWTTDDMRSVPWNRSRSLGTRDTLTTEEFLERASRDEGARTRALNDESLLGNETGIRTFGYSSMIIDPPDGRMPEFTPEALARAKKITNIFGGGVGPFRKMEDFSNYERCITRGLIGSILPGVYGNGMRIVQTPDSVVIVHEAIHETRVIPVDGRPPADPAIREYLGSSVGRWEGDTLVVETTNMTDKTSIGQYGDGIRHSEQIKITERLRRVDPDMIDYVARIEDPATYKTPFTVRMTITRQPGYRMYEFSCHEGNRFIPNAFEATREFDRLSADAETKGLPPPAWKHPGNSIYTTPSETAPVLDANADK